MSNQLTILETPISTFENLYSLNDLHKASGNEKRHQPALFLRLEQTKELINAIESTIQNCRVGNKSDLQICRSVKGGRNQGTYVCEELMLSYAMWISPKFHLTVLRTFLDLYRTPKINPNQKRTLIELVKARVKRTGETHQSIWHKANKAFGINSYHELPAEQFDDYVEFVTGMKAIPQQMPTDKIMIDTEIAQVLLKYINMSRRFARNTEQTHRELFDALGITRFSGVKNDIAATAYDLSHEFNYWLDEFANQVRPRLVCNF